MNEITCPTCGYTGEPKINSRNQVRCGGCYALLPIGDAADVVIPTPIGSDLTLVSVIDESDGIDQAEASAAGRALRHTPRKTKGKK
jgi:hypothetical protein